LAQSLYDIFGPGLHIQEPLGDPNLMSQARMSLNILRSRAIGKDLLMNIAAACKKTGNKVVIVKAPLSTAAYTDDISDTFIDRLREPGSKYLCDGALPKTTTRGKGCSAIAY